MELRREGIKMVYRQGCGERIIHWVSLLERSRVMPCCVHARWISSPGTSLKSDLCMDSAAVPALPWIRRSYYMSCLPELPACSTLHALVSGAHHSYRKALR